MTDSLESCLISKYDFENLYRYVISCWTSDANTINTLTISGINNSQVVADYEVFVISHKTCLLNVQTGQISNSSF
jgi:hypothetical protein